MSVIVDGKEWKEYAIEWTDIDGGVFAFTIYALSLEHASYRLEELKNNARLGGEIIWRGPA